MNSSSVFWHLFHLKCQCISLKFKTNCMQSINHILYCWLLAIEPIQINQVLSTLLGLRRTPTEAHGPVVLVDMWVQCFKTCISFPNIQQLPSTINSYTSNGEYILVKIVTLCEQTKSQKQGLLPQWNPLSSVLFVVFSGPKLTASSQFEVLGCMRMRSLVQPEADLLPDQRKTQLLRSKRLREMC